MGDDFQRTSYFHNEQLKKKKSKQAGLNKEGMGFGWIGKLFTQTYSSYMDEKVEKISFFMVSLHNHIETTNMER